MMKFLIFACLLLLISCSSNRKIKSVDGLPECLQLKIKEMAADSTQGLPIQATRYIYKGRTVYYITSSCCDKYNMVYDSKCRLLGYPDGGFAGRGDGKMPGFKNEATDARVVWQRNSENAGE